MTASLLCHSNVKVCRVCIGWLMKMAGGIDVTPTLPGSNMKAAVEFYESAGFKVERYDDGSAFVRYDDQSVFDLDLAEGMEPTANRAGCYVVTDAVLDWHARFSAVGLEVTSVEKMPWGMEEFTLTDPSGNRVRVGRSAQC